MTLQLNLPQRVAGLTFKRLQAVSRHRASVCLVLMFTVMGMRIALIHSRPIPQPFIADEFSYLLGAETFRSGRVTNPMHPMWEHFETLHELVRPSYMTMYPPGQSIVLALGWKLFGHPWFGVLISFGLFTACLCWMLQQWVPPVYAILAASVVLARVSILGYWMNSYWGGAIAAIGGCLVFGTVPRLVRTVRTVDATVAAIGAAILANTRPFEGIIICVTALLALLFWRRRIQQPVTALMSPRTLVPLVLILGSVGALDCYYNYRVTGSPLQMPYAVYFHDYRIAPPWLVLQEKSVPKYNHASLENSWKDDLNKFRRIKSHPRLNLADLRITAQFYVSTLLLFVIITGLLLSKSHRLWTAALICLCLCGTLLLEYAKTPHYVAGGVGLLGIMCAYGLRGLRVIAGEWGPLLLLTAVVMLCFEGRAIDKGESWEVRGADVISPHMAAAKAVSAESGRHLIFVRYSPDHIDKGDESIFNRADIDSSDIVWAHDMGDAQNRELIDYYHNTRKTWLYMPDSDTNKLVPYAVLSVDRVHNAQPRSYRTFFPDVEKSISENNNWIEAGSRITTIRGLAFGTQFGAVPPPYTDSAVLLKGQWGDDQFVQIVVWWNGASGTNSDYDEVEIRLRGTHAKDWERTYNINCRVGTPSANSYIQMGRANGPPNDFTSPIAELKGPGAACQNGDVVTATIVGNVITAYINGKMVIQGTDSVITSGAPGFGFFHQGKDGENSDFGVSSFMASDNFPPLGGECLVQDPSQH